MKHLMHACIFNALLLVAMGEDEISQWLSGEEGELIITSQDFPSPYYMDKSIYKYYISHEKRSGYIQIIASDFDLHRNSSLKIFDGEDQQEMSSISYLYLDTHRPVFHSRMNKLLLVFKTGRNPSRAKNVHIGFRISIVFVTYPRYEWKGIPSIGFCPNVSLKEEGRVKFVKQEEYAHIYDCVWLLRPPVNSQVYLTLHILNISLNADDDQTEFEIRSGPTSSDRRVWVWPENSNKDSSEIYVSDAFYIHLKSKMKPGNTVEFVFHLFSSSADSQAISSLKETPRLLNGKCPYKTFTLEGIELCYNYWDHHLSDGTCDEVASWRKSDQKICSELRRHSCYIPSLDSCDGFSDCHSNANGSVLHDEYHCDNNDQSKAAAIIFIVIFAMLVFWHISTHRETFKQKFHICRSKICLPCARIRDHCRGTLSSNQSSSHDVTSSGEQVANSTIVQNSDQQLASLDPPSYESIVHNRDSRDIWHTGISATNVSPRQVTFTLPQVEQVENTPEDVTRSANSMSPREGHELHVDQATDSVDTPTEPPPAYTTIVRHNRLENPDEVVPPPAYDAGIPPPAYSGEEPYDLSDTVPPPRYEDVVTDRYNNVIIMNINHSGNNIYIS